MVEVLSGHLRGTQKHRGHDREVAGREDADPLLSGTPVEVGAVLGAQPTGADDHVHARIDGGLHVLPDRSGAGVVDEYVDLGGLQRLHHGRVNGTGTRTAEFSQAPSSGEREILESERDRWPHRSLGRWAEPSSRSGRRSTRSPCGDARPRPGRWSRRPGTPTSVFPLRQQHVSLIQQVDVRSRESDRLVGAQRKRISRRAWISSWNALRMCSGLGIAAASTLKPT